MAALVRSPRTAHSLRLLFLTCSPPGKDTSWVGNAHPHLPAALEEGDSVMILLPLRERDLSPEARDAGWERSALLIGKQTGPRAPRIPKLPAAGAPRQASHRAPSRPPSGPARPPGKCALVGAAASEQGLPTPQADPGADTSQFQHPLHTGPDTQEVVCGRPGGGTSAPLVPGRSPGA